MVNGHWPGNIRRIRVALGNIMEDATLFDFTLWKLTHLIDYEDDENTRGTLLNMLQCYISGQIEIEWREGLPMAEIVVH